MDSEDRVSHLSCKDRCIPIYDCVVENSLLYRYDSILLSLPALAPVSTTSRIFHVHFSRVLLLVPTSLVHSTPALTASSPTIRGGIGSCDGLFDLYAVILVQTYYKRDLL